VGVQAAGVVDGAGGNNEAHPSTLAGQTEARRDAGADGPEHRVTSLPPRRHPGTAPVPAQGLFLRRDPEPGPSYQGQRPPPSMSSRKTDGTGTPHEEHPSY